jgi:hypothetical protein
MKTRMFIFFSMVDFHIRVTDKNIKHRNKFIKMYNLANLFGSSLHSALN